MRHDLHDALAEVHPEAVQATAAVAADEHSSRGGPGLGFRLCKLCDSLPASGDKLRYCGRCAVETYCSKHCAEADWPAHKLVCESLRRTRANALADHEARGGRKQDYNQMKRGVESWFEKVPGLFNEMELLAWTHRGESPLIRVSAANQSDAAGSDIRVEMIPRSFWNEDPRFLETYSDGFRKQLLETFDEQSSFFPDKQYLFRLTMREPHVSLSGKRNFADTGATTRRGVEIASALATATRTEDLTDAFAWFEMAFQANEAQEVLQRIRDRASSVHGDTTPRGSVPDPSRALNIEVASMIFVGLDLQFDVCLTGLRVAAHLNGRQGFIRGPEPGSRDRWKVRLDDGTHVSVKASNFEHTRIRDYRRISP